ncbi:hypothetical protein C2G38_2073668, partial [Gigaspora rosea]
MSIPMKDDKVTSQENSDSEWIDLDDDLVNENTGIIQVGNKSEEDSTEQSTTTSSDNSQINLRNDSDEITQKLLNVWIQSSCGYNTRFGSFKHHLYLIFGDCKAYAYIYISPQYNQATVGAQYYDYTFRPRKYQTMDIFNKLKSVMKKLLENTKRMKGITRLMFLTFAFFAFMKLISITFNIAKIGLMWVGFFTVIKYIKNNYGNMKNVVCELL